MRIPIVAAVVLAATALGSAQTKPREFEVATVKPSAPSAPGAPIVINLGTIQNGMLTLTNTTLSECLQFAYSLVSDSQVVGPDWIKRDVRFDIVAKASPDVSREEMLLMLQNLLAVRLKMVSHRDKRELPFLGLVVGKNGPRLQPPREVQEQQRVGPGFIVHPRMPMPVMATLLSRFERQIVIDMTGLGGPFAVNLRWTPDFVRDRATPDGVPVAINGASFDPNGPSLYTAIQEQLGLRLESRKGPVDVIVVDQALRIPIDN